MNNNEYLDFLINLLKNSIESVKPIDWYGTDSFENEDTHIKTIGVNGIDICSFTEENKQQIAKYYNVSEKQAEHIINNLINYMIMTNPANMDRFIKTLEEYLKNILKK